MWEPLKKPPCSACVSAGAAPMAALTEAQTSQPTFSGALGPSKSKRLQWHRSRTGPRWLRTVHQDHTCTFSGNKSSLLKASITGAFLCACLCPSWPGGGHLGWWQPNHHQYIHPVNTKVTTPASRYLGAGVGTWLRTLWGRIWATHRSMQRKECPQRTEDPPSSVVPT